MQVQPVINRLLVLLLILIISLSGYSQTVEYISTKSISANVGNSYYYSGSVKFLPGFSVSAAPGSVFFCRFATLVNQPVSEDKNFIRVETGLFPTTSEAAFSTFAIDKKQTTYSYFDGSGRPTQDVVVKGSPLQKDIVSFHEYAVTDGWQTKMYLPYVASSNTGSYKANTTSEHTAFYTGGSAKVASDTRPFSEQTVVEKSPLARIKEAYGPGSSWYGASKKVSTSFKVNASGSPVKYWQVNATTGLPFTSSNYPDGALVISLGADEDGNASSSMKDFRGNVIQTTIHATPELITYSVYDDMGRLRFVLPPEASANSTPDQTFLDKWAFQYKYDERGRVIKQKSPGTDWIYSVYDVWDKLILTQDGNQRAKTPTKEWTFIKYDEFNRLIMTGVYRSNNTHELMITNAAAPGVRFEQKNISHIGYSTGTFPQIINLEDIRTVNYFDDYSFLSLSGWDAEGNSYSFQSDANFPEAQFTTVKGQPTGSKILYGTNTWLNSVVYYDKYYRPIQSVQEHHLGGTDRTFTEYNFPGWIVENKRVHSSSAGSVTLVEEFEYDHTGRLLKNYHTINGGTKVLLASNAYNELGQLVETNTHSTDLGTTFLQSTDYRYSIRGSLTHINNSALSNDGVTNDDTNDLFGMQFVYQEETLSVKGTNTQPKYNGRITAVKWKTDNKKDPPKERVYGHYYSPSLNRLDKSLYAANSSGSFTGEAGHYDLTNLTYDKNGNLQTLNRYAEAGNMRITLDSLAYGYSTNGNQLTNVEDKGDAGFGFKNGTVGIPTEYSYDANGNLLSDLNKGITGITYNDLNLPRLIEFSDGRKLEYSYDASGYAYRKQLKQGSTILRTVDYVQGIQYFDNALALLMTSAGRAIKNGSTYEYEYFLKDHLGNTRVVYGYLHETNTYRATMEAAYSTSEEASFKNIAATRYQNVSHNHTRKNLDVPSPDRSAETNGYLSKAVGPAKMLQVSTGDKVKLEVFAKYTTSTAGSTAVVSNLLAAVTSTFSIINSGETQTAYQAFSNNLGGTLGSITPATNTPKAYLYYILFNSDYSFNQFGYYSVPQAALLGYVPLTLNITIPANGFLYTYVANESNINAATSVYFDDFTITHEKAASILRVVESIDYDPFGVVLEGTHYIDESRPLNSYLYQGEHAEYDNQSDWYRFEARGNYDASLGRWFSADPANQFGSPYIGMGNNPVMSVDPDGRYVFMPLMAGLGRHMLAGALMGGAQYIGGKVIQGNKPTPKGFFQAMARGAISSGIGYGLGIVGLEIAGSLYKNYGPTAWGGLINLTYAAGASTLKSITTNWIMGDKRIDSSIDIPIGQFTLPIRNGKVSDKLMDYANNFSTLYTFSKGMMDVFQGKATIDFDWFTFSPRFNETQYGATGFDSSIPGFTSRTDFYGYIRREGEGDSFNEGGIPFMTYKSSAGNKLHESLHTIFGRVAGYSQQSVNFKFLGAYKQAHDNRYWESIIIPAYNRGDQYNTYK